MWTTKVKGVFIMKEARLISDVEQKALATKLSRVGEEFIRNSDSYVRTLRSRGDRFVRGLGKKRK